ncbi:MAG: prenyltransferase/squalene oxidase repeat-containing protein [Bryobacteraceae bacterium]
MARLAPRQLDDSRDLVESFLRSQIHPCGAFADRAGQPDVYYTVFGLEGLIALHAEPPVDAIATYLRTLGDGAALDFVHLACLARAWAGISRHRDAPADAILARVEQHRTPDGGFSQAPASAHGTAYAAFLALGAYQDLDRTLPHPERLLASLTGLRATDGGYANMPGASAGVTTATAAAIALQRQLGADPEPALAQWLLARRLPSGGFFALPGAPIPDLLSTATALHALAGLQVPLDSLREPCLDFIDSLWTNRGGFYGHWSDDAIDTEYTYYALLSLGHLAA